MSDEPKQLDYAELERFVLACGVGSLLPWQAKLLRLLATQSNVLVALTQTTKNTALDVAELRARLAGQLEAEPHRERKTAQHPGPGRQARAERGRAKFVPGRFR